MSEKLTPEWCEAQARAWEDDDPMAEALRLSARALRAREWLTEMMIAANTDAMEGESSYANRIYRVKASVCESALAILEGREP